MELNYVVVTVRQHGMGQSNVRPVITSGIQTLLDKKTKKQETRDVTLHISMSNHSDKMRSLCCLYFQHYLPNTVYTQYNNIIAFIHQGYQENGRRVRERCGKRFSASQNELREN